MTGRRSETMRLEGGNADDDGWSQCLHAVDPDKGETRGRRDANIDGCVWYSFSVQAFRWRQKHQCTSPSQIRPLSDIAPAPDVLRRYFVGDKILVSMIYLVLELKCPYNFFCVPYTDIRILHQVPCIDLKQLNIHESEVMKSFTHHDGFVLI